MRTTAAALWALLAAILLLGPSPWSQGLPGAEAKPSTAMPVTKEDIDRREEKKAKGQPMTDDVESSLPDWEEDPVMKTKLKCNACSVVVTELVSALKLKREQRKYKLTPDENMGALERGCFNVRRDYGLQMRNNKVTPVYSKDHSIAKTEGAWISTFLINTCGMVTGKYDDYIIANYATTATHLLASAVCQRAPGFEGVDVDDDDDDDDDETADPKGLGLCPGGLDMSKANTHDDGWTVEEAIRKVEEKNRENKKLLAKQKLIQGEKKKRRKKKKGSSEL